MPLSRASTRGRYSRIEGVTQYEHLGSAIGYGPEMCLGHVYIVLEPVGSAP